MDGNNFDDLTRKLATGASRRSVLRGLVGGAAAVAGLKGTSTLAARQTKVTLCHATSSASNPYVKITIADPAEIDPHINGHGDFYFVEGRTACCGPKDCPGTDECNIQACVYTGNGPDRSSTCGAVTPRPDGTTCDDGQYCTVNDVCTDGACGGDARDCSDAYSCTIDSCDEINDVCVHTPDDSVCQDDNICTTNTCSPGAVGADGATGCLSENNTLPCDDGKTCTTGDVCSGGICSGTVSCTTPPNGICYASTGTCDSDGNCSYQILTGASCDECLLCAEDGACSVDDPDCGNCDGTCKWEEDELGDGANGARCCLSTQCDSGCCVVSRGEGCPYVCADPKEETGVCQS